MNQKFLLVVVFLTAALGLMACGSTQRPGELVNADKQMGDRAITARLAQAAPQVFKLSQRYYKLAEEAYDDGDTEKCIYNSVMASIKYSTALEHLKRLSAEDRLSKAEKRIESAKKFKTDADAKIADAKKRIKRMEEILALKQKTEQTMAQMEQVKAETQAKLQEVAQEKEVQDLLASAMSKVQTAEALDAKTYDPVNLTSAKTYIEQSQKALAEKRFQNAKDLAKLANEKAGLVIGKANAENSKKKQEAQLNQEREALFRDANGITGAEVKREQRGVVLTLYEMFAPRKNVVLPENSYLLDKIADLAKKYPEYPIVVEGYTDSAGRDIDNLTLSQGRAQAVLDYLVQEKKLTFDRIRASGYGEANPVADNSTAEGRARNRRVQVIFLFR